MADENQGSAAVTGSQIRQKAESALAKARRESFEQKLKGLATKLNEAKRTVATMEAEIDVEIEAFDKGL